MKTSAQTPAGMGINDPSLPRGKIGLTGCRDVIGVLPQVKTGKDVCGQPLPLKTNCDGLDAGPDTPPEFKTDPICELSAV